MVIQISLLCNEMFGASVFEGHGAPTFPGGLIYPGLAPGVAMTIGAFDGDFAGAPRTIRGEAGRRGLAPRKGRSEHRRPLVALAAVRCNRAAPSLSSAYEGEHHAHDDDDHRHP
jgi:hypothetical protein